MASGNIYNNSARKKAREEEKNKKTTTTTTSPREGLPSTKKTTSSSSSKSGASSKGSSTSSKGNSSSTTSKRSAYDREDSIAKSSIRGNYSATKSGRTREQILASLESGSSRSYTYDANDGKRDFLDHIGNLTADLRRNNDLQRDAENAKYKLALADIQQRPDFMELAQKGAAKGNNWIGLGNKVQRSINESQAQADWLRQGGIPEEYIGKGYIQNPYDYMTSQQLNIYNAFIGLGDRQSANKYLASIEPELQQQAAAAVMQNLPDMNYQTKKEYEARNMVRDWNGNYVPAPGTSKQGYNRGEQLGKAIDLAILGIDSGAQGTITGWKQSLTGQDEAVAPHYTELVNEQVRPTLGKTAGIISDVSNSVGFMLPAVAIGALTGGAGQVISAGLFGAASGGRTYNEMLREDPNVDKFTAKTYSIINGALEGSLQYLLGGIGKLGAGGLLRTTGKSISGTVAKKLLNVSKAAANTPAVQRLIRTLVAGGKYGAGMTDEAIEEWLQAVLDPVVRNYVLGENNEVQLFGEDQLYSAMLGALGATVMNLPGTVSDYQGAEAALVKAATKQDVKAAGKTGKPAKPYTTQSTSDQLAAYADDPVVIKLQQQIEELEEQYATEKKRHQPAIQENINKFRRALDTYIKEKEAKQTEAQEPEEVSTENAAGIPGPPPAPVQENTPAAPKKTTKGKKNRPLTSEEIDQEIARLTGEVEPVGTEETVVPERTRPEFESSQMSGQEGLDFIRNSVYNNRWQGMIEEQNEENYRNSPGINLIINGVKQLNSSLTDEQAIQVAQELQAESIERGGFGENGVDANSLVGTLLEMANEAEETGEPLSPGLQLIVDSIQKRQDEEAILRAEAQARAAIDGSGLITNAVNPTPTNNVTIPQRRGLTPAQQRVNNQRQQQANPRFLPPMPRFEDQQQTAEAPAEAQSSVNQGLDLIAQGLSIAPYMEASQANRQKINEGVARNYTPVQQQTETTAAEDLQEAIEKAKDEQLSSEEIQSIIDEQLNEGDQTARQALSEANTRAEQAATAEMYRRAMTYLQYQKERMGLAEYNKQAQALEDAYRANAAAAGVSNAEIEAVLNGSYDPRYSLNTNKEELTENEQVDRLIDALITRLEGRGALNSFERTNMPEGAEGRQFGRSIEVNEELKGTTREANAVFHEVGHLAARYDKNLVHDVIAYMRKQGMDVDSMVEERRQSYREDFEAFGLPFPENADTAYFEEEVMSKYLGEEAEKDPEILNKIAKDEPGLLQRILNMLRRLVDTLTGKQKSDCEFYIDRINNALSRANATVEIDSTERRMYNGVANEGVTNYGREQEYSETPANSGTRPEGPVQGLSGLAISGSDSTLPGEGNGGRRNPELARGILALQEQGKSFTDLEQSESPEQFYNRIGEAKRTNPFGAFVTQHEIEEYDGMNLYNDSTGTVGVAVTEDGNIVSVFKDANSPVKSAMTSILFTALSNGGVKLDNFNSPALSYMYAQHGFIPVARTAFVDEYAPDDWNYERDGRPDIVFWVHNGDSLETIANNIDNYEDPDYDSLPMFDDYDEAEEYRDRLVSKGNTASEQDVRYSFNRNKDKGPKAEHKTSQKQGDLITELGEEVEELSDEDKFYTQKAMTETYQEASDRIKKKGGVDKVYASLMSTRDWNAKQMNEATVILSRLSRGGDSRSTQALLPKYLEQQKNLGQAINAFKLLRRYMPDAVSSITQSIARDLDVELTQEELDDIKLCDEIIQDGFISRSVRERASSTLSEWLTDASKYVNRNQLDAETAAYAAAMTLVTSKQPATARQKFRALQRISLLSNPKTHFRNILGNLAEQAGSVMSRPFADATDRFMYKLTGQRTFGSGGGHAFARAVADSLERAVMDHALGIDTVGNKFDEDTTDRNNLARLVRQSAFDEHTQNAIRNGINKAANDIDKLIGLGLSLGDAPFLIGTYESALEQIMNANPKLLVDGEATAEMMDTAWDVAFRRTFRDNNAVVKSLSRIRNAIPFGGETIAPYVQTPVNVVLTAIQYSPIGFGEAICKAFLGENSMRVKLDKGESTMKVQRQIAELVGRGALGTACMLIGAVLASAGRITGDDDDIDSQKEKNWNTATGRRGSSIKVGDTYIDPSSLQSLSTPIMAGAAAYQSGKDENEETNRIIDIIAAAAKASMKMGNTMLEMPVLQGVSDLFSGNYDNGEILAGALGLAGNAVTQVVPFGSLLKQAGKAVDPYSRAQSEINTKGPGERVLKSTVNNLKTMTPWTRETLPERYDVLGNPIKNDASEGTLGRIYNSFLNPFNTSKENASEVTDEIDRLYAALKDTDVLPTAAGNSISYGGEKYKFNAAEKQEYQRIEGESNSEILSSLVNSEAYDRLSDEEKGKILENVYKYSANKAKAAYLEKQGVEYESDAKWMDSIDAIVESGVDIGDAIIYRYEISNINNNHDEQVHYINSLPLTANQKEALDDAFVDKYWPGKYIDEDRDYTNADTLALSMTSDSGREKYKNRFSGTWRGVSGNTYSGMTGEEFGLFYDAYNEGSNAAEKVEAIKQMLMEEFNLDESSAYTMAYDFRKYYAAKYD